MCDDEWSFQIVELSIHKNLGDPVNLDYQEVGDVLSIILCVSVRLINQWNYKVDKTQSDSLLGWTS